MKAYILGYNHLAGTSKKTGNAYDFYPVEFLSRRNSGSGSTLMVNTCNIQAEAYKNILGDIVTPKAIYPLLMNLEFDNKGTLVDADLLSSGDEAAAALLENLCG